MSHGPVNVVKITELGEVTSVISIKRKAHQ